jgi:uncharacterized protein (TIGR02145 family)
MSKFTRLKRTMLLSLAVAVGAACFSGCLGENNPGNSGGGSSTGGSGTTPIENNNCGKDGTAASCKTVVIGNQTWMAENLNFPTSEGSWCYENSADSCAKYGRLYDWATATTVCPAGWRLPDTADWRRLAAAAGGVSVAGRALKSVNGWGNSLSLANTDEVGFSALPGGSWSSGSKKFGGARWQGNWWLSTKYLNNAFVVAMDNILDYALCVDNRKGDGFSVRCVAD